MKKKHLALVLMTGIIGLTSCGKKTEIPATPLEPAKEIKVVNLADYSDNELFVQADSLEVTQVNPNVTRRMVHLDDLMVTIIEFSNGPMAEPDPFHSHPHEQVSYVAEGECIVFIGDRQMKLTKGDIFAAPSNVPHTVQSLTPYLKLIDSFSPVREDFMKK